VKLSIIIPVYDEAATIGQVLNSIAAVQLDRGIKKELIIVNDGSTDKTDDIVAAFRRDHPELELKYQVYDVNRGKGCCIREGIALAAGEIIVIQDADLEYDPNDYRPMLECMVAKADVVYGSRFLSGKRVTTPMHRFVNWGLTFLMNRFTKLHLTDVHTGLKMFRAPLLKSLRLEEQRFGFCPEVTAKLAKIPELRWTEVPVSYRRRDYAEGKKIRFKDGLRALYCILKYSRGRAQKIDPEITKAPVAE